MKRRWKIIDGKRCLLKAGSNPFMQQPFNEVIASLAAERLEIPHVPYTLLWDSGSSLGYDKLPGQILSGQGIECKPFKKTHAEQLKLVSTFDWVDFDRLAGSEQEIQVVLDQAGEYVDETRKNAILSAYASRLQRLMELSQRQEQEDKLDQDVESNLMRNYSIEGL